ncbi:MAG: protein phosphatase [Actinomycetota bacterium]
MRGRPFGRTPGDDDRPDLGIYLAGRDPGPQPWDHRWIPWRDFWLPADRGACVEVLRDALGRSGSIRVEVACRGGRGRTGAALGIMAILDGVDPGEAQGWVRRHYDRRAIETPWQRRWLRRMEVGDD